MNHIQKRALWIFLILALFVGGLWQFYPLPTAQARLNRLPLNGPSFQGKDVPLAKWEEEFFTNVNIVKRIYEIDNKAFFISILDGSHNRHVVHDPYYCFRGAGWTIDSSEPFALPNGEAKLVAISKGDEKRKALFWFSDGTTNYTSPMRYWWETTLRRLTLGASGAEPILIMIQPIEAGDVDWKTVAHDLGPLFFNN